MHDSRDTGRIPATPSTSTQLTSPSRGRVGLRRKNLRHENPSLSRYTDLRFEGIARRGHRRWVTVLAGLVLLVPLTLFGILGAIYWQARTDEARPVDAIVVMGAAQYNGHPSEVLEARLDHALELYRAGLAPMIIVTGGNQPGDTYTEAGTSEQYLIDRGVPPGAILMEDQGQDTWESIEGVATVTENTDIHTVLIVSDGFHLFRAERMANAIGLNAYSSAAPDSPIAPWSGAELSYAIRETGAVIAHLPDILF